MRERHRPPRAETGRTALRLRPWELPLPLCAAPQSPVRQPGYMCSSYCPAREEFFLDDEYRRRFLTICNNTPAIVSEKFAMSGLAAMCRHINDVTSRTRSFKFNNHPAAPYRSHGLLQRSTRTVMKTIYLLCFLSLTSLWSCGDQLLPASPGKT